MSFLFLNIPLRVGDIFLLQLQSTPSFKVRGPDEASLSTTLTRRQSTPQATSPAGFFAEINMESPNGIEMSIEGGFDCYAPSEGSSSETSMSETSSSPTSTTYTSISDHSSEPLRYPQAVDVIASPPTVVKVGDTEYYTSETRVMADTVAQARKTSELPPTKSSPLDAKAIIEDYTLLAQLRLARGDPALPPPEEYTRFRVETARRIRERDAELQEEECRRAATRRVEGYLKVVEQEKRYHDFTREIAKQRGVEGQGKDMERITEEVMAVVEKGIGSTAESLDMTAGELDSTAGTLSSATRFLNTVACSLAPTATTLNFAATNLDSTASSLESTLGVMATQIGTLNTQLLALTNILQSQTTPTASTKLDSQQHIQQTAVEDSLQESIEHAIRDAMHRAQAPTPHSETASLRKGRCGRKPWGNKSFSDSPSESTAMKTGRQAEARRTGRRASRCKYVRIVIDRILG